MEVIQKFIKKLFKIKKTNLIYEKPPVSKVVFLYPKIMKQLNTPFKLGMQYDNWEFDLEVTQDRIEHYDSYKYVGKQLNKFLNICTDEIELLFSLDILEAVIITYKDKDSQFYKSINLITTRNKEAKHHFCIEDFTKFDAQISCIYKSKNVYIIYAGNSLIKELVGSIR